MGSFLRVMRALCPARQKVGTGEAAIAGQRPLCRAQNHAAGSLASSVASLDAEKSCAVMFGKSVLAGQQHVRIDGIWLHGGYTKQRKDKEKTKGLQVETGKPLFYLVAGARFELATFGL